MPLLKEDFQPREYQKNIAETALNKNCLVVLPTGIGKTFIAILVAAKKLEKYPESKVLMLAPSRPLVNQHMEVFKKYFNLDESDFIALTGKIIPEKRIGIYDKVKIIFSTSQLIQNDIENGKLNLSNVSLLIVDECHRSVKKYSYPFVAKKYMLQSKYPLILGLTASPGGTSEKIQEICDNLFIKTVEIRSEVDTDVERYVKPIQREWIYVDFPEEFQKVRTLLEEVLKDDLYWLREHHYTFTYTPTKKMLLEIQKRITARYIQGSRNYAVFWAMMRVIGAVKIEHAIELLETQGISFLFDYLKRLEASKKKTDTRILKDTRMREAIKITEQLNAKGIDHPKLEKIVNVIKDIVREKSDSKIIVFANYRATVNRINELLKKEGLTSEILIGQATKEGKGLSQQEQIEVLRKFANGEFNILCGTSISEEGLSIPDVDDVIFYESVPSEIRSIQRRGRTGRTAPGKVIYLITKGTLDEKLYWTSFHKERKMKGILYDMKGKEVKRSKTNLLDWAK
jgi:Fanconi anemia group M protein